MATKRGTKWQGVVYHASLQGGRFRRTFETKDDALAWEADSRLRLKRGEAINRGDGGVRQGDQPYTLKELADHVYKTRWKTMPSGLTQYVAVEEIIALIGPNMPISKVGKLEIDKARTKLLETGNQPSTVNRKVAALSTCLTEAVRAGLITHKPYCAKFKESEHRIRVITEDEERRMLMWCNAMGYSDLHDYIILSLDTGLRQGELLGLRWPAVSQGRVTVWGSSAKSGKSRVVPLTGRSAQVLTERAGTADELVFPGLTKRQIHYWWEKLSEVMLLVDDKEFVPHAMRHTFCSRLARKGAQAPTIMALAGHSTLAVSQRYIHLDGASLETAIETLNAPVATPTKEQLLQLIQASGFKLADLVSEKV